MKNLKVLIADDHAIVRHGLCALLNTEHGIEVAGEAKDGNEAVALAKQSRSRSSSPRTSW